MRLILPPPRPPGSPDPPVPPRVAALGTGARLWLVRHAEVAREFEQVAYGAADVPLSPQGEEHTRALAAAFGAEPVRAVHSSDLARALAMGRAFAESTGAPLVIDPALREIDRGAWTGLSKQEFHARWRAAADVYWRDPFHWRVPEGDSEATLFERAWPAVLRALRAAAGGTAVVTAHANLIRVVVSRALGCDTARSYELETGPARAMLLVDEPDGWRLAARDVDRPGA
jgi:broad specificity phosphatase PhoE